MNFRYYHWLVLVSAIALFGTALISFVKPQWLGIAEVSHEAERINKVSSTNANKRQNSPLATEPEGHDHDHGAERKNKVYSVGIPKEIDDALEKRRIPASELKPIENADGSLSMDTKGQFEHVTIAVQQPDGKIIIVEKQIQPIPDK